MEPTPDRVKDAIDILMPLHRLMRQKKALMDNKDDSVSDKEKEREILRKQRRERRESVEREEALKQSVAGMM